MLFVDFATRDIPKAVANSASLRTVTIRLTLTLTAKSAVVSSWGASRAIVCSETLLAVSHNLLQAGSASSFVMNAPQSPHTWTQAKCFFQ